MTMFENMHIFNAYMLGAKLQHRTWVVYSPESKVYLTSNDTDTLGKIDWQMCFHTHHIVQCIPVTNRGK